MRYSAAELLAVLLLALVLSACTSAAPAPPATAPPTSAPTQAPAGDAEEDPADVQAAFIDNVQSAIDEAAFLAGFTCDNLRALMRDNPQAVPTLRGYALTLQRLADHEPLRGAPEPRAALQDLERALAELNGALSLCGLNPT